MPDRKKVIMVDMDGTLTHSAWRNHLCPKEGGSWEAFHAECDKDEPTKIVQVVNFLSNFFDIVISTARPHYVFAETHLWIKEQTLFDPIQIMMRGDQEYSVKSPDLKKKHKSIIEKEGCDIVMIIDDRKDVCNLFEKMGVPAMWVNPNMLYKGLDEPNHDLEDWIVAKAAGKKSPDQVLIDTAEFYVGRNKKYKDAWLHHGEIMAHNFPNGLTLKTPEDFFFMHCLVMDVVKTTRICNAFSSGEHHEDSWLDKIVYAAMAKSQIKD